MMSRTGIRVDLEKVRALVDPLQPLYRGNRLYVTSRPGAADPLHDGEGWLAEGESEAAFTVLNESFRGTVLEELLGALPCRWGRVRLMVMPPKSSLSFHRDDSTRLHLAIHTNPGCYLIERQGDSGVYYHVPADGSLYRMDTRLVHSAVNTSREPRLHLVIANLDETGPPSGKIEQHPVRPIPQVAWGASSEP